jgi:hypothetical protein
MNENLYPFVIRDDGSYVVESPGQFAALSDGAGPKKQYGRPRDLTRQFLAHSKAK